MNSAQLFITTIPTGDCVTLGSHKANFEHAINFLTEAAMRITESDGCVFDWNEDPNQTVANLMMNDKILLGFKFT